MAIFSHRSQRKKTENTGFAKATVSILLCLAFVFCAVGCSDNGKSSSTVRDPISLSNTAAPTAEPQSGGILNLPMPVNAAHNDPLSVNTEEMLYLFSLVYDDLIAIDEGGSLVPSLAESWVNEGEGVWLIRLREDVRWHDTAVPLSSQDVLDTYEAIVALGSESYYAWCTERISKMEIVDELSLRVTMNEVGMLSLYALSFPICRTSSTLIGTGPYKLASITDERITLTVNERWWDKTPYIGRIIFSERDSNETALASYEAGQLNMVPTAILTAGKYTQKGVTNVLDVMTQGMEVLLFNHNRSTMQSVEFRKAIAHAINRNRIITNVYMNRARASDAPIPADHWLYDSRCAVLNYDPTISDMLLTDLGYRYVGDDKIRRNDGAELNIRLLTSATTENTTRSDAANMIAAQLGEIGIGVEVVTAEHTLGSDESPFLTALREGDWDIALVGFNLCIDNDLTPYFTSNSPLNFGNYSNGDILMYINKMKTALDEESLREAAYQFQLAFVEQIPFVTLYFRLNSVVYSAEIGGISSAREPDLLRGIKDWYFIREDD